MKKIYSLILVAASLAVAACQPKELDNIVPDDNPDVKSVKITATIEDIDATKVEYAISDEAIKPAWEVDDELFGFDANGGKFTYVVKSVDENTGEATIEPKQGTSYTPEEGTVVYGIYYPGKDTSDIKDGSLAIDLAGQDGTLSGTSPAIMCATATVTAGADGNEIRFKFANQTAIIGLKKIQLGTDAAPVASATIDQIAIEGVVTHGKLSVDDGGEIKLTPGDKASTVYAVPSESNWTTDDNGLITFVDKDKKPCPVAFAVLPKAGTTPTVYAYTADAAFKNGKAIDSKTMVAGNYYYMSKKLDVSGDPVASLTVGGVTSQYFTIDAAFDAADCSNANSTITLLADCGAASQLALNTNTGSGAVTLDLNGHELTTITTDYGILVDNRTLTIEDKSLSGGGEIKSESTNKYLLYTSHAARVTISSGTLSTTSYRAICVQTNVLVDINGTAVISSADHGVYSYGTLNVSGTASIAADSYGIYVTSGTTTISENATVTATEDGTYGCYVYSGSNKPKLVVTGGTIKSLAPASGNTTKNAIRVTTNGKAEISGGSIEAIATTIYIGNSGKVSIEGDATILSTDAGYALINVATAEQSELTVTGGRFTAPGINPVTGSGYRYVKGGLFNRPVNNLATHDESNTPYYNSLNTDAETQAAFPYCLVSSMLEGVSLTATATRDGTVYDHASIESAINHVTVDASASNTELEIKLIKDAESSTVLTMTGASKAASLDLNNHTWTSTASPALTSNVLSFTLCDNSSDADGEISTTGSNALSVTGGTTTIDSGSLVGATNAATVADGATLNVSGGYLYGNGGNDVFAEVGGIVALAGGWFYNQPTSGIVSGMVATDDSSTVFKDRTYTWSLVQAGDPIVRVNGTDYTNLVNAINDANESSADNVTIELLADITCDDNQKIEFMQLKK